jgi:hypothetical protein
MVTSGRLFAIPLLLTLGVGCAVLVEAGEPPVATNTLEGRGLKLVGSLFLVTTESEVHAKLAEVKALRKQLVIAQGWQRKYGTAQTYQQTIRSLGLQLSQLKSEIQAVNQQMNRLPHTRRQGTNNLIMEQYDELRTYRDGLQAQANETTAYLNQFKSQPFDPKTKARLDADVRDRRRAYEQGLVDLRSMVDKTQQSYRRLAADESVKQALHALGKNAKIAPKLGPSHEFSTTVKFLEKLEHEPAESDFEESLPGSTRGSKTKIRPASARPMS